MTSSSISSPAILDIYVSIVKMSTSVYDHVNVNVSNMPNIQSRTYLSEINNMSMSYVTYFSSRIVRGYLSNRSVAKSSIEVVGHIEHVYKRSIAISRSRGHVAVIYRRHVHGIQICPNICDPLIWALAFERACDCYIGTLRIINWILIFF